MPSLEIALATHNSARFLPELLQSLFHQTYQQFTILVADDNSTDDSLSILSSFQQRYPTRLRILEFPSKVGGPRQNFARLVEQLTADYAMFCDHDDVWLPNKIDVSIGQIRSLEATHGPETPLLFHTDLVVTGPNLEVIAPSYWSYTNVNPRRNSLRNLLVQGTTMGCALIMNRALYQRAGTIPPDAIMHDCWMTLVAAAFGKIEFSSLGTILYRQHGSNYTDTPQWNMRHILRGALSTFAGKNAKVLTSRIEQARAFLSRFADELTPEQYETTAVMANLLSTNRWLRWWTLLHHGLLANGVSRNLGLFVVASMLDVNDGK